ncbi:SPOR domain-containing protein [Gilvimarinus sp. DA14]|uniref:SPOR domain-containing protein n=1 Tax=Gilvimarinus sp. DA14 TaxID=2956798 RepID=UPI0020B660A2|nr:SPOR domain-containing protein [Gilvimarinus sp. DA14]UTF60982.1 SPOR domain-containing protein [Gilvimarinus sp. DA14]
MNDGLKQRLIGALVLAGLAVIFLPGFFKEQQMHQVDTRSQIPPRPEIDPVVISAPQPITNPESIPDPDTLFIPENNQPITDEPAEAQSAAAADIESEPQPMASENAENVSSVEAVASVSSSSHSSEASEALADLDAWVVQVASLRSAESAQTLRKKLQDKGYKAYVRLAQTSQGEVSRVFIGPKVDKALAETVKAEVDPAFKVNSLVLKFKP